MNERYPKVLIIGNSFDDYTGGGITLTNLFMEWPQDKIAVAARKIDVDFCNKERPCYSYFDFSSSKNVQTNNKRCKRSYNKRQSDNIVKRFALWICSKSGFCDFISNYKITDEFLKFYDEFQPEIIYSPLGNISIMRFFIQLLVLRKFRLVIHIWDEFLARLDSRWFSSIWKKYSDSLFKRILEHKDIICLAIGDKMAEEYHLRYGHQFYPFHNPVDPSIWDMVMSRKESKEIIISYFGKINSNTINGIIDLAKAIEKISNERLPVIFKLHSGNIRLDIGDISAEFPHTQLCELLPREEIPVAFKENDFLFYPISFDKKSIDYQRLSIHTKLTEYLISQVPIIMYGSDELAVYQYLKKNNAAILCKDPALLEETLRNAIKDRKYAQKVSNNAYQLALRCHTTSYVRSNFLKVITSNLSCYGDYS